MEQAIVEASKKHNLKVIDFTVAPQVNPVEGLPYHEWFVEFENAPESIEEFAFSLDDALRSQNMYYDDLIKGSILRPLVISNVKSQGFRNMMKARGKLGGQNKVPRLSNDRNLAEDLAGFVLK